MRAVPRDPDGLDAAARALGGAVLGPRELTAALGFDALAVLTPAEQAAVARVPFGAADLERARAAGEMLVLRVPRDPEGPLTMLRLAARLRAGLDPAVHKGVGYLLRPEWTIDDQPFAAEETCTAGCGSSRTRAPFASARWACARNTSAAAGTSTPTSVTSARSPAREGLTADLDRGQPSPDAAHPRLHRRSRLARRRGGSGRRRAPSGNGQRGSPDGGHARRPASRDRRRQPQRPGRRPLSPAGRRDLAKRDGSLPRASGERRRLDGARPVRGKYLRTRAGDDVRDRAPRNRPRRSGRSDDGRVGDASRGPAGRSAQSEGEERRGRGEL